MITQISPYGCKIKKNKKGNRYVIPDIHGCHQTLKKLLKRIDLTKEDQLFFLGDFIDRGPGSSQVLDHIMDLIRAQFQVYVLRGNHEQMLLDVVAQPEEQLVEHVRFYKTEDLLVNGSLNEKYRKFISDMPFYYLLDQYILVHAGLDFSHGDPLNDHHAMMWIRDFPIDESWLKGRKIIHGHNPTPLSVIQRQIKLKQPVIPLDNGCVLGDRFVGMGNLLCLELDSMNLVIQPYAENKTTP